MHTNTRILFIPIACLGLIAAVSATAAADPADEILPEVYECWADPFDGTTCDWWVQRTEHNPLGGQDLFRINMRCYQQMEAFVLYENLAVEGWVTNIGNSETNNGHGGDAATNSYDGELDLYNFCSGSELGVYRNDYCLDCVREVRYFDPIPEAPGYTVLRYLIRDGLIRIFPRSLDPTGLTPDELVSAMVADSRPLGEAMGNAFFQLDGWDEEAQAWNDRQLFAGINRVIMLRPDPRVGRGAIFVFFRLSDPIWTCEDIQEMTQMSE